MAKKKAKVKKPVWGPEVLQNTLRALPRKQLEDAIYLVMLVMYGDYDLPHGIDPNKEWDSETVEHVAETLREIFTQKQLEAIMGEVSS